MTEDARAAGLAAFHDEMEACVADLNVLVPDLTRRYDITIIMSAMAEQVGAALQALRRKKVNDDRQTALAIERIEKRAFGPYPAEAKAEEPGGGRRNPSHD
jgi:5'-deoxynucleotidase YfbR-like HD superfamily hydrolase